MNKTFYNGSKKEHFIREYKYKKKDNNNNDMNNGYVIESESRKIATMVFEMQIGMLTKLHIAAVIKSPDLWNDSGSIIQVYNDKDFIKTYAEIEETKEVMTKNANSARILGSEQ